MSQAWFSRSVTIHGGGIDLNLHPVKKVRDSRGDLVEIFDDQLTSSGYVYSFSLLPGTRRGDHFHRIKEEWAVCISGEVQVLTKAPGKEIESIILSSENPQVVYFPPLTAHAFVNLSAYTSLVVSYGSKKFSSVDPDTFPQSLAE